MSITPAFTNTAPVHVTDMIRFLFFLSICFQSTAATWYVRPGVYTTQDGSGHPIPTAGVYGTQNGTSYANAWNGIYAIVWSGMSSGDTLYVCGTHAYKRYANLGSLSSQASSVITKSGITIRGDYPSDAGTVSGVTVNFVGAGAAYSSPDVNGVYNQVLLSGAVGPPTFYVKASDGTVTRLKKRTVSTWVDGLGGQYWNGQTNYVQLPDGATPTTNNVAQPEQGYAFDLNNQSNLTFRACNFVSADPVGNSFGAIRHTIPANPYTTAPKGITFTNCVFTDSTQFYLYPGEDNFTFGGCEFTRCATGPYSLINASLTAPQAITVTRCYFHDIGTTEYPDGDSHAVGIQGGSNHVLTYNICSNTGPAIVLWTGNVDMKTNIVAFNFIQNTRISTGGSVSDGIGISGDNSLATFGRRTGNKIYGNIIIDCATGTGLAYQGIGISCNSPDYVEIYNNSIYGGNIGIDIEVTHAGYPINVKAVNNIIDAPALKYFYMVGQISPTNVTVDYNLYWPAGKASTISPSIAHDTHSATNDPALVSATPSSLSDFALTGLSPAIHAGTDMGLAADIIGTTISQAFAPDIGAYQFISYASLGIIQPAKIRRTSLTYP